MLRTYHRGRLIQHGRGFGSIFAKLARHILPFAKSATNVAKVAAKSHVGKEIKKGLKEAAVSSALDILQGESPQKAAKKNFKKTTVKLLKDSQKQKVVKRRKQKRSLKRQSKQRALYPEDEFEDY